MTTQVRPGTPRACPSGTPKAYPTRLPIQPRPLPGEAIDSYLERAAVANGLEHTTIAKRLEGLPLAYLPIAPDRDVLHQLAAITGRDEHELAAGTIAALAGIDLTDLDPANRNSWRNVASRGWAPGRGTQLCSACIAADGVWRIAWRHPWVTVCLEHETWLHAFCPTCAQPFRSQRHSILRSVDTAAGLCGNPNGFRGQTCPQDLATLDRTKAPRAVIVSQARIASAIHHQPVQMLGEPADPKTYLAELNALTVLLLHLASQPGGDRRVDWADAARADGARSAGGRGARWGLAPPADSELRGRALTEADLVLTATCVDQAVDRLGPWLELAPDTPDGRLGWLSDHTAMTPLLARLVMAATATRTRISTQLARETHLPTATIPQVIPLALYARHAAGLLGVTEATGRLFASLCLAKRGRPGHTWGEAAVRLGLPAELGPKTARACSGDLLCTIPELVEAINSLATDLSTDVDYRQREHAVRRLAARKRWYRTWARQHHPGSHHASRRYAVTWLWAEYAGGHLTTSPDWTQPPTAGERAYVRRYADRLNQPARGALLRLACANEGRTR